MSNDTSNPSDLKLVTQKSMEMIGDKEIVLPSTYRVIFSLVAKKHNINIGAEAFYSKEEISDEVYKRILSLDSNTTQAIQAIEKHDTQGLQTILENVDKLKQEIDSLKKIAYEDGLTKALNRKWFEENYLNTATESFIKSGVLALIDLNDFKKINDTLGHAVGDKVLVHIAAKLKKLDAHLVRYGGDEFMLVFDHNTAAEVHNLLNVIRELYVKKKYRILENEIHIKFGYGISTFEANDRFPEILSKADSLLYEDKEKLKKRTA